MKTIKVSIIINIDEQVYKVQHDRLQAYWRTVRTYALLAHALVMVLIIEQVEKYDTHIKQKHEDHMATFPKHSLFCECRNCHRSFIGYHRFLKKELRWGDDGHII